jgi:hypothetical protein
MKIPFLGGPIRRSARIYLFLGQPMRPSDLIAPNPIMRATIKTPISDGWIERNRLAIENQFPVSRTQRSNDLFATPAATLMNNGRESHGHVKRPFRKILGNELDKLMLERRLLAHGFPISFINMFPSIV